MMSVKSRRELVATVAPRSRATSAKERRSILDEFAASTDYKLDFVQFP